MPIPSRQAGKRGGTARVPSQAELIRLQKQEAARNRLAQMYQSRPDVDIPQQDKDFLMGGGDNTQQKQQQQYQQRMLDKQKANAAQRSARQAYDAQQRIDMAKKRQTGWKPSASHIDETGKKHVMYDDDFETGIAKDNEQLDRIQGFYESTRRDTAEDREGLRRAAWQDFRQQRLDAGDSEVEGLDEFQRQMSPDAPGTSIPQEGQVLSDSDKQFVVDRMRQFTPMGTEGGYDRLTTFQKQLMDARNEMAKRRTGLPMEDGLTPQERQDRIDRLQEYFGLYQPVLDDAEQRIGGRGQYDRAFTAPSELGVQYGPELGGIEAGPDQAGYGADPLAGRLSIPGRRSTAPERYDSAMRARQMYEDAQGGMTLEQLQQKYPNLPVGDLAGPVGRDVEPNTAISYDVPEMGQQARSGIPGRQPSPLEDIQTRMAEQQLEQMKQEQADPVRQLERQQAEQALEFQEVQEPIGQIQSVLTEEALDNIAEPVLIDTGESSRAERIANQIRSVVSSLTPEQRAAVARYFSTEGADVLSKLRATLSGVEGGWGNIGGDRSQHSRAVDDIISLLVNQESKPFTDWDTFANDLGVPTTQVPQGG